MRHAVLVLLLLCVGSAKADEASQFLEKLCVQGFDKTSMPKPEAARFCACVIEEVMPRLSGEQRRVVAAAKADLDSDLAPSAERLAASGVRDLVVAGQARCEAAFYPPTKPINVTTGTLELTLRCNSDTRAPETFVYSRGMALLSKAELRALDQRMTKGNFDPEYAKVTYSTDGGPSKSEQWEIDVTGEIVAPPNSGELIDRLRTASMFSVVIERGAKKYSGTFQLRGRIPARWIPCDRVGR